MQLAVCDLTSYPRRLQVQTLSISAERFDISNILKAGCYLLSLRVLTPPFLRHESSRPLIRF
jgi:hypothetical protein